MRDPYPLPVHALVSNSARARARYLLHLLRAEPLCADRWRLPGGTVISGEPDDLVRSVDHVKQIEDWVVAREHGKGGDSEFFLNVACFPPFWDAKVRDIDDEVIATAPKQTGNEALARIEVLIAYAKATGLACE